jgi:hypothetical protein
MLAQSAGRVIRVAMAIQALLWICACSTTPTARTEAERVADDDIVTRVRVAFLRVMILVKPGASPSQWLA